MIRVFLSSTGRDLQEYRLAAFAAISSLEGYHCVRMEDFTSQSVTPLRHLKEQVGKSNLLVSLVGLCYGESPPDSPFSFTELEYTFAKESGIPCLAFLLPDNHPVPGNILHADGRWLEQQSFRRRVSSEVVRVRFASPDQLATQLIAAIRNWETSGDRSRPAPIKPLTCVILCGGYAQRLWPLTIDHPKVLLPIGGRSVLERSIQFASSSHNVLNIILSTNERYAKQIASFAERRLPARQPIEMIIDPEHGADGKLGPLRALDYVSKKMGLRDALVVGGDNLFGFELDKLVIFAAGRKSSVNAVFQFRSDESVREYGVAQLNSDGSFADFEEKQPLSTLRTISTACYLFREQDMIRLDSYLQNGLCADSLGSFLHRLTRNGFPPVGFPFSSFWFDIGTREKMPEANRYFLVDERAGSAVNSRFEGPVQSHESAHIENSFVGPNTYFGRNVRVYDSEVRDSIILDGCVIRSSNLSNSVVGPNSMVEGRVSELVCGAGSKILQ